MEVPQAVRDRDTRRGEPRVEAYRSLAEIAPLAPRLDALDLASRRPSPFDTFAYLEAFVAHDEFAEPGRRLVLLVAFDGDEPVGWLPLRRMRERLWGIAFDSIRFLVSHDGDRPRVVARPEDEARCAVAFYRHLFDVERGWSLLLLNEQDEASKLLDPSAALDPRRYYLRRFPNNANGTVELPYTSLAEYLRSFSKTHRRNAERAVRRLVEAGSLEVVSSSDPAALPALFDLYLDLERRSWKAKIDGHIGRHPERVAFFRQLLEPGQPLAPAIHLLVFDGVPIAGFVCGAFAGGLYGLETGFDEGYRHFSPGNAMLLLLIRDAIEKRYRFLDLLGNYAYYKSRWHATITDTCAVQIFRKGSLVYWKALAGEIRRWLRPPVAQADVAFNMARKDAEPEGEGALAALPDRREARARAEALFAALAAAGAKIERLGGEALGRAVSLDRRRAKGEAPAHRAEVRS